MLRQSTINRNSPIRFHRNYESSGFHRSNNSATLSSSSSSSANFIYRGADKQQWSKLIGLIEQKFMAKDIGYLDDEEEVASRKIPPPSPIFLEPPMHVEDPRDRDIRLRQQLLIDEERKLAAATARDYKEKFARPATTPRPSRSSTASSLKQSVKIYPEQSRMQFFPSPTTRPSIARSVKDSKTSGDQIPKKMPKNSAAS